MSYFDSLTPKEFILLANLVAFALTEGESTKDTKLLADFLSTVSSIMFSISAQKENLNSLKEDQNKLMNKNSN